MGGWPGFLFFWQFFWQFPPTCEKTSQLPEPCKHQGGKTQVKPFGLKLQTRFPLIGKSEKSGIEIESGYQSLGHPVYGILKLQQSEQMLKNKLKENQKKKVKKKSRE